MSLTKINLSELLTKIERKELARQVKIQKKKEYYGRHKNKVLERAKQKALSPAGKLQSYKNSARLRGYRWGLTDEQFISYWKKPCEYCGDEINTIGLDRIDNSRGYETDNIISCCETCNKMKNHYSVEKFIQHCKKVTKFSYQ